MHRCPVSPLTAAPCPQSAQRAAKYAAVLALMAIDPEDRNRAAALRALRDYVITRRQASGAGAGALQHWWWAHHPGPAMAAAAGGCKKGAEPD